MPEAPQAEPPRPVRVVDAPLVAPSHDTGLLEVVRRRYLLKLLVRRELSARYQGSVLGFVWSYINPMSQLFIYWFVIGKIIGLDRIENFAVHVFAGLIVIHFFTETFNAGTRSIMQNKALVRKMAMPRETFPVASMLVSGIHVLPQLAILLVVVLFYGWRPDPLGLAAGVLGLLVVMTLGLGLALMFSVANVFFRDFQQGVSVLTNFVRFSAPMIYPFTMIEDKFDRPWVEVYLANPIAEGVLLFQRCFWTGSTRDPDATVAAHIPDHLLLRGGGALLVGLVVLVIGQLVFTRIENKIPERI